MVISCEIIKDTNQKTLEFTWDEEKYIRKVGDRIILP